jgi:hypothetical protein
VPCHPSSPLLSSAYPQVPIFSPVSSAQCNFPISMAWMPASVMRLSLLGNLLCKPQDGHGHVSNPSQPV